MFYTNLQKTYQQYKTTVVKKKLLKFYKKYTPTYWVAHREIVGLRWEHAVQTGSAQIPPADDQRQHEHYEEDAGLAHEHGQQQGPGDHAEVQLHHVLEQQHGQGDVACGNVCTWNTIVIFTHSFKGVCFKLW